MHSEHSSVQQILGKADIASRLCVTLLSMLFTRDCAVFHRLLSVFGTHGHKGSRAQLLQSFLACSVLCLILASFQAFLVWQLAFAVNTVEIRFFSFTSEGVRLCAANFKLFSFLLICDTLNNVNNKSQILHLGLSMGLGSQFSRFLFFFFFFQETPTFKWFFTQA